jgi:hypothetical protein
VQPRIRECRQLDTYKAASFPLLSQANPEILEIFVAGLLG